MKKFLSAEESEKISKQNEETRKYHESYQHHADLAAQSSTESFGVDLAKEVAQKLVSGQSMNYVHRDYCGHGLSYNGSRFILATYLDGIFHEEILSWSDLDQFVAFLQQQSDFSMSGASPLIKELAATQNFYLANQTITKNRLQEFVS